MVFNATFNNISLYTHLHITAYLTTYVTLFGCCRSAYCRIHGKAPSNSTFSSRRVPLKMYVMKYITVCTRVSLIVYDKVGGL